MQPIAIQELARIELALGHIEAARTQAKKLDQDRVEHNLILGDIALQQKQRDAAISAYQQAVALCTKADDKPVLCELARMKYNTIHTVDDPSTTQAL